MSYSVDELFEILENEFDKTAYVCKFLKDDEPEVTHIEIPAEYNGKPVTIIEENAFESSKYLREVFIPDSVAHIGEWAFAFCPELREVRLPRHVKILARAFSGCPRLAPEIIMAGLIECPDDLSAPFNTEIFSDDCWYFSPEEKLDWDGLLRPEVFALAVKYDSFRLIGTEMLFKEIVRRGLFPHFEALENAGISPSAEQLDNLIELSGKHKNTEMTAYLLDLKNRKFDFKNGGDKFEL